MKVLVLGVGSIGKRHITNLVEMGYKDIVVYDPNVEEFTIINPNAENYSPKFAKSFEQALNSNCKIAFVCSPPHLHNKQALACANKGMHLFIEKPLSNSLEGIDELLAIIKKKKLVMMTACNYRFSPTFKKVKNELGKTEFGKPLWASITYGSYLPDWRETNYTKNYATSPVTGGGVLFDAGIHFIDFLLWLFGSAQVVSAALNNQDDGLMIKTEDCADFVLKHDNGVVSCCHSDYFNKQKTNRGMIVCQYGTIEWDFIKAEEDVNLMYVEELKHFLSCVSGKTKMVTDIEDGKKALEIALRIKKVTK